MMMIEGILSIIEGEAPKEIEQKLLSFLPAKERRAFIAESRDHDNAYTKTT